MNVLKYFIAALLFSLSSLALADKVNINTADAATLASELVGVGAAKAEAIVKHRETQGNFATPDDITDVAGIGEATYEKNKDKISVGDEEAAE